VAPPLQVEAPSQGRGVAMSISRSSAVLAVSILSLAAFAANASAQSSPSKKDAGNEGEVILQDSKKTDRETSAEVAECIKQWGPQTQMTKEEWTASCRRTLHYFPESK
jgi:spermidine/putrescine-binding protein